MKLSIKKKYFDQIKRGRKKIEFRDAHITFVAEETKETLTKNIDGAIVMPRGATYKQLKKQMENEEFNGLFDDNFQLWLYLEDGGKYEAKNNTK